jgi:N-acetylmuramoyl-L-alanine amidase
MKLIRRASWGARHGRGPTNINPAKGGVAIHYLGPGRFTGGKHSRCAARVRAIEHHHVKGNGWAAIAYNFLVCEHGFVFEGRGLGRRSAAQGTTAGNDSYYAVCALIGSRDTPGERLKSGTDAAIRYCRRHGAASRLKGHRDFKSTSCPGGPLYEWLRKRGDAVSSAPVD